MWSLGISLLLTTLTAASPGSIQRQAEGCVPPHSLTQELSKTYPGARLVTQTDLSKEHRALFRKDHGARCPGLVRVDFYGDGRRTWALVLLEGLGPAAKARLILAREFKSGWKTLSLESTDAAVAPVIWTEGPGKYRDVYDQKTVLARHPVIVFAGYESWAILYAWTGTEIAKIWISD